MGLVNSNEKHKVEKKQGQAELNKNLPSRCLCTSTSAKTSEKSLKIERILQLRCRIKYVIHDYLKPEIL